MITKLSFNRKPLPTGSACGNSIYIFADGIPLALSRLSNVLGVVYVARRLFWTRVSSIRPRTEDLLFVLVL